MTVTPQWLDITRVADIVGVASTASRLAEVTAAAEAWVTRHRNDLDLPTDATEDLIQGTAMYAARLYLQRGAVSGVPEYDQTSTYGDYGGMADIYRLVGSGVPGIA